MRRLKVGVDVDDGNRGPPFLTAIIPNQITLLQDGLRIGSPDTEKGRTIWMVAA